MISLAHDQLEIRFPGIGNDVGVSIDFQRTLRIPDNDRHYHLPPGLGRFPLRHIEDFDLRTSEHRKTRGGIIMPMFQTDALWLNSHPLCSNLPALPVALKIGAGKINAISGERWSDGLSQDPQGYVVLPDQPWLDGFNVAKGVVRQFVAMPLGRGYTVEEQMDAESDVGGIQLEAVPMKKDLYEKMIAEERCRHQVLYSSMSARLSGPSTEMGLGMGGSMRQEVYEDEYGLDAWDLESRECCFVMLANAEQWMLITGEEPPLSAISAEQYSKAGLPWFDYFDGDRKAIEGAKALGKVKSIKPLSGERRENVWPQESSDLDYPVKMVTKAKAAHVSDGSW